MKLKNRLILVLNWILVFVIFIIATITIPLQFLDFMIFGRIRITVKIDDLLCAVFQRINQLKKQIV